MYVDGGASVLLDGTFPRFITFLLKLSQTLAAGEVQTELIPRHSAVALSFAVIFNRVYFREGRKGQRDS